MFLLRIISGTKRGARLSAPEGLHTRPTADNVKEAIFNIIQFDIEGRTVLDLFCGTGQLGLEALSRGAAGAVFVDSGAEAVRVSRENAAKLGFSELSKVVRDDVPRFLGTCRDKYGLVFIDPPYGSGLLEQALALIMEIDILRSGGIMVCECGAKETDIALTAPYRMSKRYRYGATSIMLFTRD